MRKLIVILGILVFLPRAFALEVEYFNFTNSKTYALTEDALLSNSLVSNSYPWMFTAAFDYVKAPLTIFDQNTKTANIIDSLEGMHIGGGYRLSDHLFIGVKTYVAKLAGQSEGLYLGDSKLEAKWKFWEAQNSALALIPTLYLPTGSNAFTRNSRKLGESLAFVYEHNLNWVQISLMGGVVNKPGATFEYAAGYTDINYKQSLYTAIGSVFPLSDKWALNIEGYRYNQLIGNQHPNEVYFGVRNQTTGSLSSFLGISLGDVVNKTSNDYRFSLGIKYSPAPDEVILAEPRIITPKAPVETIDRSANLRDEGYKKEKDLYGKLIESETIYFSNGSFKIDKLSADKLKKFQAIVKSFNTSHTIVLEGFASKKGNSVSNMQLSKNRINETEAFLFRLGVNPKSIVNVAYGDSTVDPNVSESINRKVVLRLYKTTD